MKIQLKEITVKDLVEDYFNNLVVPDPGRI